MTTEPDRRTPGEVRGLTGRVIFPAGTPADEQVFAIAGFESEEPEQRVLVASDGSFRFTPFEGKRRRTIGIDARYLFLEEEIEVSPSRKDPLVLDAMLGGAVRGSIRLHEDGSVSAEDLARTDVELDPNRLWGSRSWFSRETPVAGDLTFEFGGVDPRAEYTLRLDPRAFGSGLAPTSVPGLSVQPGEVQTVELEARLGARVSGSVMDDAGHSVPDAHLECQDSDFGSWSSTGWLNDAGGFEILGLPAGDFTLSATAEGYDGASVDLGSLDYGESRTGIDLVLRRGYRVAGRVQWPDGSPASGAEVEVAAERGSRDRFGRGSSTSSQADDDGDFDALLAEEGPFIVVARAFKLEEVTTTSPVTGKEKQRHQRRYFVAFADGVAPGTMGLVLTLGRGLAIAGMVRDDVGTPIDDFQVRTRPEALRPFSDDWIAAQSFRDAGGVFEIEGLTSGTWEIQASARGHGDSEVVSLELPATAAVTLVAPRLASIEGVVVDPAGQPAPRAEIFLRQLESRPEPRKARADGLGRFGIDRAPPGAYVLVASGAGGARSPEVTVDVAPGAKLAGVELRLARGGRVTGEVVGVGGGAVAIWGEGFREDGIADARGFFAFEGVPPGEYEVAFEPTMDVVRAALGPDAGPESAFSLRRTATVLLAEGDAVHVELRPPELAPVQVAGRVSSDGEPIAGRRVLFWSAAKSASNATESDAEGRYELTLPFPGPYQFSLDGQEFYYSTTVEVPRQATFVFDVTLETGRIAGVVRDIDGAPLGGVRVGAMAHVWPSALPGGGAFGTTDAGGGYSLDAPAGTYTVLAGAWDESNSWNAGAFGAERVEGVVVAPGERVAGIDFELARACSVEGRILFGDGSPVAHARVAAHDARGRFMNTDFAGDGRYGVSGLTRGLVTVSAVAEGFACVSSEAVELKAGRAGRLDLVLVPATKITVRTLDSSGSNIDAEVEFVDGQGRVYPANYGFDSFPAGKVLVRATFAGRTLAADVELSGEPEREVVLRFE